MGTLSPLLVWYNDDLLYKVCCHSSIFIFSTYSVLKWLSECSVLNGFQPIQYYNGFQPVQYYKDF
jgi:hypothetical protein